MLKSDRTRWAVIALDGTIEISLTFYPGEGWIRGLRIYEDEQEALAACESLTVMLGCGRYWHHRVEALENGWPR